MMEQGAGAEVAHVGPFTVVAGKIEGDGERNYKYIESFSDVMDAVDALNKVKGYHFAEIEYRPAPAQQPQGEAKQAPKDCQHGYGDVCAAGARDGVVCPEDSCDIDDGVRAAPSASAQQAEPVVKAEQRNKFQCAARGCDGCKVCAAPAPSASPAALTEAELRAEFEYQHEGRNLKQHRLRGTYVSAPIAALWNQHKRTAIWMQSRAMAATAAASPADQVEDARRCQQCNAPRKGEACHKCGAPTVEPCAGWEEPALPPIDRIRELAREIGYAMGVHGTLERDLDLIAAPWSDEAARLNYREVMQHIADGLGARLVEVEGKPLGRRACTIQMDGWYKPIDLSVCPMLVASRAGQVPEGYALVPLKANQQICQVMQWKLAEWPVRPFRVAPVYEVAIREAMRAKPPAAAYAESGTERRPEGWIPVTERLPEGDGVFTLCFWEGHTYVDCFYDGSDGEGPAWEEQMPSHWMPLPLAPSA